MSTKRNVSKRMARAALRKADRGAQLAKVAALPGILYVWRDGGAIANDDDQGNLIADRELPDGEPNGRIVGVYHLVDAGELKVTRELKR